MTTIHATRAPAKSTLDKGDGLRPLRSLGWEDPVPGWVWREADMIQALAVQDIAAVFRGLQALGLTQRRIALRTGQAQSEVSEVLAGRHIVSYTVLTRIADGLGIPRGYLGLAYQGPDDPAPSTNPASTPTEATHQAAATTTRSDADSPDQVVQTGSLSMPTATAGTTDHSTVDGERSVIVRRCLRCTAEAAVDVWTGHEIRLLREAMRMTVRRFSNRLDVSERMVSKWEAGGRHMRPRPHNQAALDTLLARADDADRKRFAVSLATSRHATGKASTQRRRTTKARTAQTLPRQRMMYRPAGAKQEHPSTAADQFAVFVSPAMTEGANNPEPTRQRGFLEEAGHGGE